MAAVSMRMVLENFRSCNAIIVLSSFFFLVNVTIYAQDFWQQTNGPSGGFVHAAAINTKGYFFISVGGVSGGGIYRSTDEGESWALVNGNIGASFIAIDRRNDNVFVAAGEVFKSPDDGMTWQNAGDATAFNNNHIAVLAIKSDGTLFAGGQIGGHIYRSKNDGTDWEEVHGFSAAIQTFAVHPRFVFAGTLNGGILRSANGDKDTWFEVNNGVDGNITALASTANGILYAGPGSGISGIFKSTNDGNSWTNLEIDSFEGAVAIAIDQDNDIFASSRGKIFRSSTNSDNIWVDINAGLMNVVNFPIVPHPTNEEVILVGTNGNGPALSTNNGDTWVHKVSGLPALQVRALAISPNNTIFAGTNIGGVFRSGDDGENWEPVNTGLINSQLSVVELITNSQRDIFVGIASGFNGGIFRSDDNGNSWSQVNPNLERPLAINSNGDIFAGDFSGGLYISSNNGDTWSPINNGLTNTNVLALAINSVGFLFAGTAGGGIFRSSNNGDNWVEINNGLTSLFVQSFGVNSADEIFAGTREGIFRSQDNGDGWEPINNGLSNPDIQTLALNSADHIFAGTGNGVFRSNDNGDTWTELNTGLTDTNVRDLVVALNGIIYAGTDVGVVKSSEPTIPQYPSTFDLNRTINYVVRANASDYNANEYRIVGLPGGSNQLVSDFLPGVQNMDWQVVWDNGEASDFFVEYDGSPNFRFRTGRAFWIINRGDLEINATVPTAPLNANGEVEIPLHKGWNLITNPFNATLSWSEVQNLDPNIGPICSFDSSFQEAQNFDPFEGYYFFNDQNLTSIKIPFSLTFSSFSAFNTVDNLIWRVSVALNSGEFTDKSTSFGIARNADLGLDGLDYRKPRSILAIPSVSFQRPEWDPDYSTFAKDIRPEFEESETWDFDVLSPKLEPTTLTFSGVQTLPTQHEIFLIDDAKGVFADLHVDSVYKFTPRNEITKFRVIVGKADAVDERLSTIVPQTFELGPNYPNPFNPSTKIPIAVPVNSEISLKVYNIRGQEVRTIYSGQLEAGRHLFEWDGKGKNAKTLASGVYIYRLTSGSEVALTGKMVFMR